jgi:hypothetical protein
VKTQLIRLIDEWALGPFMIYAATRPRLTRSEKIGLAFVGAATILYNLANYQAEKEKIP